MSKLIEPVDRTFIHCKKCRADVVLPSNISNEEAAKFASITRHDSIEGMRYAEHNFSFGSREAKVLVLHVTGSSGLCRKCGKPVAKGESICACRSVNLNW